MRRWTALFVAAAAMAATLAAAPAGATECARWSPRVVASGLGSLENLEPDGTGGMLISASSRSAVERLLPDGTRTTIAAGMPSPGGLRVRGRTLYATTGDAAVNGVLGTKDGTIQKISLVTGKRSTYTDGLTMPNGLVFATNGDAYTSRDLGTDAKVTRVPADDPSNPDTAWADLPDTNGLAIDPSGTWLYTATTFNAEAAVFRILLSDPTVIEKVAELGSATDPVNGLDDMTIDADGLLYITANGMGRVFRLDPVSGASCVIADGLQNPSAVKFGRGSGWAADRLYVSGFDGRIVELTPPV